MIAYEEKATLPGRQCGINQKQNYITRLSAGGQRLSDTGMIEFSPGISGTAAMAQLGGTAMQHTQSPKIPGDTLTEIMAVVSGATSVGHTTEKSRSFDRYPDIGFQFFGSMPRCFNSFLTIRLSHAERVASPSSCIAATIASSSAGSTRKAICLLPLGIFMFDMCLTLGVIFVVSSNVHHVSDTCKARGPAVLPALTGPLTTNRYTR